MRPDDIDYAPLHVTPSRRQTAELREQAKAGTLGPTTADWARTTRPGSVALSIGLGGVIASVGIILLIKSLVDGSAEDVVLSVATIIIGVPVGAVTYAISRAAENRWWRRAAQLVAFGRANALEVEPQAPAVMLPGTIFIGEQYARTNDRVTWTAGGLHVEAAVHHAYNTVGKRYLAIELGSAVPTFTFHCGAGGPTRGPIQLGTDAFAPTTPGAARPRYRLMCATSSHARARAFMTDELLELLTDGVYPCNCEVADGWFFAYYKNRNGLDERLWRHSFAVADAVARSVAAARTSS